MGSFTPQQLAALAEALVASAPEPMAVVDREFRIVAVNSSFQALVAENGVGQPLLSAAGGQWDKPAVRRALEAILVEEESFDDLRVSGQGGEPLFLSAQRMRTANGDTDLIAVSLNERAIEERTEDRLIECKVAQGIVETVREPMLVLDFEHRVKWANHAFYRFFRLTADSVEGRLLHELADGAWNILRLRTLLNTVLEKGGRLDDFPVEHEFPEIGRREMMLNAGRVDHLRLTLLAFEDVTERQRHARRQDLLMAELAHRIKNSLAVAQSLAFQTQGETVEDFKVAYLGRLKALAVAQDALLETQWQGADLQSVVNQVTLPYVATTDSNGDARLRTQGPPLSVSPQQVTGFALILNELATNASKYGALSIPSGRVAATWKIASDQLLFEWREEGGPPSCLPANTGFGTKLIDRIVSTQLNGKLELSFQNGGLRCVIHVPMSKS